MTLKKRTAMPDRRPPLWVTVIIVLTTLPLFTLPRLLDLVPPDARGILTFVWIYPFYLLLSGWLAWKAWGRRPEVTWILVAVMWLSTIAIHVLAANSNLVL